jgi:MFS family permease
MPNFTKTNQYYKFCFYGFLKNLRFFDAFFILFLLDKELSYTEIGLLYAIREIFINIFEIPSGIVADTYGRKNALMASFVAYIISFITFYLSTDFWLFMLAFILYGIGEAFRSGTHKGMIMDYLKLNNWSNQKINYYGHTRACSQKGSAISSLIAGILVFFSGSYQNIFLFSIIPYLLNLILIGSYPKELNLSLIDKSSNKKGKMKLTFNKFWEIIKKPNVLKIINTSALHSAYLKAVKDYIQPLMVNIALIIPFLTDVEPNKKNGLIIGILYFVIYLLTSKASQFASAVASSKKDNISFITIIAGFTFGILSGVFFFYDLWIISLIAFVGIYLIENIRKPILTGFVSEHVPNEILTSVMSVQSQLKTVMTAILAFTFGVIADYFGIGIAFVITSAFLLISTLILSKLSIAKSKAT